MQEGEPIHDSFKEKKTPTLHNEPGTLARKVKRKGLQHLKANHSIPKHKVQACSLNYHYRVPCYLEWATDSHLNGGLLRSAKGPLGRCKGGKNVIFQAPSVLLCL